jgi:hypothetical protein
VSNRFIIQVLNIITHQKNACQKTQGNCLRPVWTVIIKKITSAGEDVEKREPLLDTVTHTCNLSTWRQTGRRIVSLRPAWSM